MDQAPWMDLGFEFYGRCKLCGCEYMGGANHQCSCGHEKTNHMKLEKCKEENCDDCPGFQSTDEISQCYHCLHEAASHTSAAHNANLEEELLRHWVLQGHKLDVVRQLYNQNFGTTLSSTRSIARRLSEFSIRYSEDSKVSDDQILSAIKEENALGVLGYRRLHTSLRVKYGLAVTRDRVTALIKSHDLPRGVDPKCGRGPLHQNPFRSKGPNWLWSVDGHEKQAQPYGIYIYGVLDTYSRKILALHVLPDKKSETVGNWLLQEVRHIGGLPERVMVDKGTEWNLVRDVIDVVQMKSVYNQKIEAFWGKMNQLSDMKWYRLQMQTLESEGFFTRGCDIDRWITWRVFASLIQQSLNEYRALHNSTRIRKQTGLVLPSGHPPNFIWANPQILGTAEYLKTPPALPDERPFINVDMDFITLPDALLIRPTKANCVQLYKDIHQYIQGGH